MFTVWIDKGEGGGRQDVITTAEPEVVSAILLALLYVITTEAVEIGVTCNESGAKKGHGQGQGQEQHGQQQQQPQGQAQGQTDQAAAAGRRAVTGRNR